MFFSGVRPAINVGLSVSRVGGSAQIKAMRAVAGTLRLSLAQFRELEAFAQFGSDLDATTQQQLKRGARLVEILKQGQYVPCSVEKQVAIVFAATQGFLDDVPIERVRAFEQDYISFIESNYKEILTSIASTKTLSDDLKAQLKSSLQKFKESVFVNKA